MDDNNIVTPFDVESLGNLRYWLHSEISIRDSTEQGDAEIVVTIRNDAPVSSHGGNVVFIGVGLRIKDGRDNKVLESKRWLSTIKIKRLVDNQDLRREYQQGAWVSGIVFPAVTEREKAFGEVLFPGESIMYVIRVSSVNLPYLDIQVQGQVSRRHLFHLIQPMEALRPWIHPLLVQTFRELDAIDLQPFLKINGDIPELGPDTTLADIEGFRNILATAITYIDQSFVELNKSFHAAPNQELRNYMKQVLGKYLTSVKKASESMLETLSSGNTQQLQSALVNLMGKLETAKKVEEKLQELKSRFGINDNKSNIPEK